MLKCIFLAVILSSIITSLTGVFLTMLGMDTIPAKLASSGMLMILGALIWYKSLQNKSSSGFHILTGMTFLGTGALLAFTTVPFAPIFVLSFVIVAVSFTPASMREELMCVVITLVGAWMLFAGSMYYNSESKIDELIASVLFFGVGLAWSLHVDHSNECSTTPTT